MNAFDDRLGVFESSEDLFGAAVAFDQTEFECTIVALFVYVRDGAHEWTHDDLGVVVEKVDLKRKR